MNLDVADLTKVVCPKCGKRHFIEDGFSDGQGGYFDAFGIGIHDCVFRMKPKREYINGELINKETFIPSPTKQYYKCAECGCRFSIETTFGLNGVQSTRIIDEDEEQSKRNEAYKKAQEERQKRLEEERKKQSDQGYAKVETINSIQLNNKKFRVGSYLGSGKNSEIDLGGLILKSDVIYTDEQIKNIKDMFGWEVRNK